MDLDGGQYEMLVNSCFEDLEGGVGLKGVWEFVSEVRKNRGIQGKKQQMYLL